MNYKHFREVQPVRSVLSNFASGQINFGFEMSERDTWNPGESYIKFRIRLRRSAENNPDLQFIDNIAPSQFLIDNIFQQINMKVNGVIVSEWNDYIAQNAALKYRLYKDLNVLQSQMSDLNYTNPNFMERQMQVVREGIDMTSNGWGYINLSLLGFEPTYNRYLLTAVNNIVTFVPGVYAGVTPAFLPDIREIFQVGDYISVLNNVGVILYQKITELTDATHLRIESIAVNRAEGPITDRIKAFRPQRDVARDKSLRSKDFEVIWKPPIGFFDIYDKMSGDFKLELTPHAEGVWQLYALEAPALNSAAAKLEILEMNMYLCCYTHAKPQSFSKTYSFADIVCSSQNLTTSNLTGTEFQCDPRMHSVTIAFQQGGAGLNTRYPRTKFITQDDEQNKLIRYYLQKDGLTLPSPIPSLLKADSIERFSQRYFENFSYANTQNLILKKESLAEWYAAGIYFHYRWGSGYKSSDKMRVYTQFSAAFAANPQLLFFQHYNCSFTMNVSGGKVSGIKKN